MNRENTLYGGLIGDHGSSFKAENIKNSYYLDTASSGGDYDDGSYGTPKNAEAFSQGEIAYKLQAAQTVSTPRVWGQAIGTDPTPIFGGSTIYQVTFMVNNEEYATRYANYDKCVTLPANPTKENYRFYYWSKTNSPSNDRLTSTTSVRSNMTVYAVAQGVTVSSGKGDVIIENRRKALNINLYDYVQNASGTDKRFTFRLQRGTLPSGLTLENGIISGTTEQTGVFSLEFYIINDEVQLMGLDSSGTTLKLKLIIGLDGEGTAESPYLINNLDDFKLFCDIVNSGETYLWKEIELRTDIDLDCSKDNLWEPIGVRVWDGRNYMDVGGFGGTFNGNGHTISGLYSNESNYSGLFDYVYRGSIKNLTVSGTVEGNYTVGGIAAEGNYANFSGCVNLCTVNGIETVGGIVGTSHEGSISDCINAGAVTGTAYDIGGISGDCLSAVTNCRNVGTVKGTDETCSRVGGIAGRTRREVKNCYNTGSVSGKEKVGGISGHCDQYNIQFCFNKGSISGTDGVGGIAGYTDEESIINCYNTGSVSGNTNVGGVNGYTEGNTSYCYNVGTISGSASNIGGVVGYTKGNVTACYYLDGCNGDGTQLDAPYGTALSAADIKKIESFSDWDFEGKWTLNSGRPMLKDNAEMRDFAVKSVGAVDGTMSAELFIPFAGTYHVAFAAYEGNKLKDNAMITLTVNATDQGFKTVNSESEITLGVGDKVMLLSDIIGPMCGAYVITEE